MFGLRIVFLAAGAWAAGAVGQESAVFAVDAAASDVHWRIYKSGTFAALGHNHVISAGELTGTVTLAADQQESSFELTIPAAGLIVDDPKLRARYGEDFSSVPSADDIAGTRANMLGEHVLDAANFPVLQIRGKLASGDLESATFALTVVLRGREVSLQAPGQVVVDGNMLVATGEFHLTHADLGMEPFSVMMGALAVGQDLDFAYSVRAVQGL